jgi:hypothetical protein
VNSFAPNHCSRARCAVLERRGNRDISRREKRNAKIRGNPIAESFPISEVRNMASAPLGRPLMPGRGRAVEVSFHKSNCNFIPAIGTQFRDSNSALGPMPQYQFPHWGPNINDWVPAIGWGLSIVGAIIFGRNTNTMADLLVTRNASGVFSAFVNGHFDRRCRPFRPDLGERRSSRLVATATEKRLKSKSNHSQLADPRRSPLAVRSITSYLRRVAARWLLGSFRVSAAVLLRRRADIVARDAPRDSLRPSRRNVPSLDDFVFCKDDPTFRASAISAA